MMPRAGLKTNRLGLQGAQQEWPRLTIDSRFMYEDLSMTRILVNGQDTLGGGSYETDSGSVHRLNAVVFGLFSLPRCHLILYRHHRLLLYRLDGG